MIDKFDLNLGNFDLVDRLRSVMLPLPLTFGLVPIFLDLCKCRSSWICIFVSKPYVFVGTLLWQFDSQIDLPCFALYVSQVSEPTIIVIWKCIEFALLTFGLVSFERILLIVMFLYILVSPDLFPALLSLFDKIELRFLP